MSSFETRGVLAARYKKLKTTLTHALFDGATKTACGRILEENLCDVVEKGPPTCPACAKKTSP